MTSKDDFDAKGVGSVPAYPVLLPQGIQSWDCGLLKRELLAAMAMQAMRMGRPDDTPEQIAQWAVADADALLKELSR